MKRLIEKMVFSGLVTACRRAKRPTRRSPFGVTATTDGVSRSPSAFGMTVGSPPSMVAMTEFVVPRSMPIVRAMFVVLLSRYTVCSIIAIRMVAVHCRSLFGGANLDHRRPEDAFAEPVARRVDGNDAVAAGRVGFDRLVHRRIELLSQ